MSFTHFTLPGRTGAPFKVIKVYDAAGFIPSVLGESIDGKWRTAARIADVQPLDERQSAELERVA
jgi:hypothetical protein